MSKQVNAHLQAVLALYSGCSFVALIGSKSELIDYATSKSALELKKQKEQLESMLGVVAGLRHAALDFGTLLKQRNVQPRVTVRGADNAFVCHPVRPPARRSDARLTARGGGGGGGGRWATTNCSSSTRARRLTRR